MTLSADRNTLRRDGNFIVAPVAANTKIFAGGLTALNAAGNAVPGSVSTTLKSAGRAEEFVDNSTGVIGEKTVKISRKLHNYSNSAVDPITRADIGNPCYIVDDETVAKTNGTNTRSVAGTIWDVDSEGVWVKFA